MFKVRKHLCISYSIPCLSVCLVSTTFSAVYSCSNTDTAGDNKLTWHHDDTVALVPETQLPQNSPLVRRKPIRKWGGAETEREAVSLME